MTTTPNSRRDYYSTRLLVGLNVTDTTFNAEKRTVTPGEQSTTPILVSQYAKSYNATMPKGFYGFFGKNAPLRLHSNVDAALNHERAPIPVWDLSVELRYQWNTELERPSNHALAWKDTRLLSAAYLRTGMISGPIHNVLRFFTGDKRALNRLVLQPWEIDQYAAALSFVFGDLKSITFDALGSDGQVQQLTKIYDPRIFNARALTPNYSHLSALPGTGASNVTFLTPSADWSGWTKPSALLTSDDEVDLLTYMQLAEVGGNKDALEALRLKRARKLHQQGRFLPLPPSVQRDALCLFRKPQTARKIVELGVKHYASAHA